MVKLNINEHIFSFIETEVKQQSSIRIFCAGYITFLMNKV